MAQENMQEWATNPVVVTQTVKIVKEYLEKKRASAGRGANQEFIGIGQIAKFLNWDDRRVTECLKQLNATGQYRKIKKSKRRKGI